MKKIIMGMLVACMSNAMEDNRQATMPVERYVSNAVVHTALQNCCVRRNSPVPIPQEIKQCCMRIIILGCFGRSDHDAE